MGTIKHELKLIKKRAELARKAAEALLNKVGSRFPGVYDWGEGLVDQVLNLDSKVRSLEDELEDVQLTKVKSISSEAVIKGTESKTIDSDSTVKSTTTKTISSDSEVSE